MKVAFHLEGRRIRGCERQALYLAAGLLERGHRVVASCRRGSEVGRALEEEGVRTTGIRPRGLADLVAAGRFGLWLRRERVDAVLETSWKRAFAVGWAARAAGVPRLVMRMGGPHAPRPGLRGWKQRHAFGRAYNLVVVNSLALRRRVLADFPALAPGAVRVVPNGVRPVAAAPARLREEVGLPGDATVWLAVGGLEAGKGHDLLIDALARLPDDTHLAVAGGGPPVRRRELRERAASRGVEGRLHLLGRRGDVPALLAAADGFVHASRTDSLPNALLEAMAAGRPVVSTRVDGAEEALAPRDGRPAAGWLVDPEDAEGLASALAGLRAAARAGDDDLRARAEEARWRAERWFGVERMVEGYEAALAGEEA